MVALESEESYFKVKPKMHLFLELCELAVKGSNPAQRWTYRDEVFGGTCSRLARRRGGLQRVPTTSRTLLDKFRMLQPPPKAN
eukprot:3240700-Amphidinium_carterae.1